MNILIVDMIEGFTRTGPLASPRVAALIPKQVEFLQSIPRDSFIIFACDSHSKEDSEFKRMPVHCMKGTKEAEICHELLDVLKSRQIDYEIVEKSTHSAFYGTILDAIIASAETSGTTDGTSDWVVIGCVTDICIAANIMELDYRGKNVIVCKDLVDTYEITPEQSIQICGNTTKTHCPELINNLFFDFYLPGVWGVKIVNSDELLQ